MGVFDKIQGYSARKKGLASDVFDVSDAEGCFFAKLHEKGYLMYRLSYADKLSGDVLSEAEYAALAENEKVKYEKSVEYTELYNMLSTSGDQLVIANAGSGKALANDTGVMVPGGIVPISKLSCGDIVYGSDLAGHKVVGVYPQGEKQVVLLRVANCHGEKEVRCCSEHLWAVFGDSGPEVVSAGDILKKVASGARVRLAVPGPYSFDACGQPVMSDTDKGRVLYGVAKRLLLTCKAESCPFVGGSYLLPVWDVAPEVVAHLEALQERLANPYVSVCSGCVSVSAEFFRDCLSEYDIYSDPVISMLSVVGGDSLHILDGGYVCHTVVSAELSDSYAEMTCIEVDSPDHLFLLEGFVPTHNTTALIFKLMHDIITGEATRIAEVPGGNTVRVVDSIFVGTFLKSGAEELEERLSYWQRGLGYTQTSDRISFSTLHAEFKRALNTMGAETPIGKSADVLRCLRKAVDGLGITNFGSPLTQEDYNVISGIVTYARGRLDSGKYAHPSAPDYGLTPALLDRLLYDFAGNRQKEGIMDFEDLQELLYKFLYVQPNQAVQDFCAGRYKYVYLDEFQDTSQIQYAILKFYARGRLWMNRGASTPEEEKSQLFCGQESEGKVIAVGDPDQTIYSWRGSDNRIIESEFDKDFRPTLSALSYNYRCPSRILDAIVPSIKVNSGHEKREYRASQEGGVCLGYKFTSYPDMLKHLVSDIEEDVSAGNTVAVLCRTNYDGVLPAFMLENARIYDFSISGSNMTFDSPLPRKIVAVTSLFTERSSQAVRNTLSMLVPRHAQWDVKKLVDTLKVNGTSVWRVPEADLEYSCPDLAPVVASIKSRFFVNGKREPRKEMDALKYVYMLLKESHFSSQSLYSTNARAYIDSLLVLMEGIRFESVFDFLDHVNTMNERLHARIGNTKAPVSIATVHEFKGKERDSVIVWNDTEGVFPSAKTDVNRLEELEEERRVHYVACTRARKKSRVYTIYGMEGMFVKEMDMDFGPVKLGGSLSKKDSGDDLSEDEQNLLAVLSGGGA